jgi:regulator of RNase E activity RraB
MTEIPVRPLKKINITVPKETKDTTQYILDKLVDSGNDWERAVVKLDIVLASPELESINKSVIEKFLISKNVFNVSSISETKKIAMLKKENNIIDTKMDIASAIKIYADLHVDAAIKSSFLEIAMGIFNEYKNEVK